MNRPAPADKKKEHILTVIRRLLAAKGFSGTTISEVAKEAGISRGLLHYYFKNKEDMLAQVIRTNMAMSIHLIDDIFRRGETADHLAEEIVNMLQAVIKNDPDFFKVFFESWAIGRQSPIIAEEIQSLYGGFREAVLRGLTHAQQQKIIAPKLPLEGLAALVTGIVDGMGLQFATEAALAENQAFWEATQMGITALFKGAFES